MPFPQTNLGAKLELQIAGVWTNATRYDAKTRVLLDDGIVITRGKSNVQDRTPASTCTWTWLDPNGVYNNENPRSPYFGLLPRNTPVRVSIPRATPALNIVNHLDGANSSAPHATPLGITGDIDIRIEVEPRNWRRFGGAPGQSATQMLVSKSTQTVGGISWYMRAFDDGKLNFTWSTTGSNQITASSTAQVPLNTPRMALRVQLQVNNGSGGYTVTFATAPSINGAYTTLGAPIVTTAGVTSVFNATGAPIEIGTYTNGSPSFAVNLTTQNFYGRVYAFQLRNGLGGTLVASPDFTAQTNGTTAFADGLGNTWTNKGIAEVTDADYRFYGELSAPEINPNVSFNGIGVDVRVRVTAAGIIRRLTQNATPVRSTMYRGLSSYSPSGYWPGGDGSAATVAASVVATGDPAIITDISFSGFDPLLPGSEGVMTLGGTGPYFSGAIRPSANSFTEQHFFAMFKFPTIPLSAQTLFSVYGNGASTVKRWDFIVDATTFKLVGYDSTGTAIVTKQNIFGTINPTTWTGMHFGLSQSGGTVNVSFDFFSFVTPQAFFFFFLDLASVGTTSYTGTVGAHVRVGMQAVAALSGVKASQIMVTTTPFNVTGTTFYRWATAFVGETADARFKRTNAENGMFYNYIGRPGSGNFPGGDTQALGPQPIDTLVNILYEGEDVENGMLMEARDQNVLEFRSRNSLSNQLDYLPLSYSVGKHLTTNLKSTLDDTNVANDITLTRRNGSSARATLSAGPMSVQAPPNGIGLVPNSPTVNNFQDSDLPFLAQYVLGVSTWPEARYPSVGISMHRSEMTAAPSIFLAASMAEMGELIVISDLPQFMQPDPIRLMIQGTVETLKNVTWDIQFNTSPYGPYDIPTLNTAITGLNFRASQAYDSAGVCQTQLAAAVNTTATSLSIKTLSGPLLSTLAGDYPADVFIGGERITIASVAGATSPQTATVTRSINGIVKAQAVNAAVTVVQVARLTLDN